MITRRNIMISLGAAACGAPGAFAHARKVWRIGVLTETEPASMASRINAFTEGLSALGYAEKRDYVLEARYGKSDLALLPPLAAELVALRVDVIVTTATPSSQAALKASREIPIVLMTAGDPVGNGLAASLAHPGGNVTGLSSISSELYSKRLDLLRQLVPQLARVGLLYNSTDDNDLLALRQFESDCTKIRVQALRAPTAKAEEVLAALNKLARDKAQALIVTTTGSFYASRKVIAAQAAKLRIAAVYGRAEYVDAGGLFSYGADYLDLARRSAAYVDQIFKGAKPGNLSIEMPMKFEFVLNMPAAKALGVKIPYSILLQTTRVIE